MVVLAVILSIWNAFNSFLAITSLLASKMNDDNFATVLSILEEDYDE